MGMERVNAVKFADAQIIVESCIDRKAPCFIWGAPGLGKTAMVQAIADKHKEQDPDFRVITILASMLDPVDGMGVPSVIDGRTHFNPPGWLPDDGNGIIFLDELSNAPDAVQHMLLGLPLERRMGNYRLPDGWAVVAAGNRITDGTFSRKLSKALGSRFATHVELVADLDDWCRWAIDSGIKPEFIAFLRLRPDLLHCFDPKDPGESFPCPRTWEAASKMYGTIPERLELAFLGGCLGDGPATEVVSFLRTFREMPNLDAAMMNPDGFEPPESPAMLYAICGAMAHKANKDNAGGAFKVMAKLPVEFQVLWLRDALMLKKGLPSTPEFTRWIVQHGELLTP